MRSMMRIGLIICLLLILAACGSESESAEEPAAAGPEVAVDDEVAGTDEEEVAPEVGVEDDDEAAVTAEADNGDEATDASDAEDMSEETAGETSGEAAGESEAEEEDTAADEPAEEMAEGSGGGWGESGTAAQSACDHPYMPLREGATWTYDTGDGTFTWEVTTVEGDLDEATATVLVTLDDLTLNYTWNCQSGQGISSFDFAGQGLGSAFPEMTMELTNGEGEFLPPEEEMVPGHSWTASFDQTVTIAVNEGDQSLEINADMNTVQNSTLLSLDPVSAAGETVDGAQIEQVNDITVEMDMMGTAVEQTQSLTMLFALGRGVGMVQQEVQSEFGPSRVDLVSYFVP